MKISETGENNFSMQQTDNGFLQLPGLQNTFEFLSKKVKSSPPATAKSFPV